MFVGIYFFKYIFILLLMVFSFAVFYGKIGRQAFEKIRKKYFKYVNRST